MRTYFYSVLAVAISVGLLAACNSNDSVASKGLSPDSGNLSTQVPGDGVRRITVTELKDAVDKNLVLIIDARGPEAYAQEHIKGSINVLEASLDTYIKSLPRDKMLVTYCS